MEARIDREHNAVVHRGRPTLVRPYPISIEWPSRWLAAASPPSAECRGQRLRRARLAGRTLSSVWASTGSITPRVSRSGCSRSSGCSSDIPPCAGGSPSCSWRRRAARRSTATASSMSRVEALAERINDALRRSAPIAPSSSAAAHHEPPTVFRYYRAADLCYVTSLHDGMNLVAKEFVAARDDERGVLVLEPASPGPPASSPKRSIVNPYDLEEASEALATALRMPPEEAGANGCAPMRRLVSEFNVYRWAGRMLVDAARLRQHDASRDGWAKVSNVSKERLEMKYLVARSNLEVLKRLAWSNVLLGFDYDGTLSPIVTVPAEARLRPRTRELLETVARSYPSVVISGRSQPDIMRRTRGLGLREVIGNHGLEPRQYSGPIAADVRRGSRCSRHAWPESRACSSKTRCSRSPSITITVAKSVRRGRPFWQRSAISVGPASSAASWYSTSFRSGPHIRDWRFWRLANAPGGTGSPSGRGDRRRCLRAGAARTSAHRARRTSEGISG